jgi:putative NADPH-quinone reductase
VKALVVYGHPLDDSYCAALRDRAVGGLRAADHDVDVLDLYAEAFDPVLTADERAGHLAPAATKPHLADHFARLRWAEAVVLVYPTWWGGPPAIVKGWLDRVWANEVAFDLPPGAPRIRPRLSNVRRLVVVTTHGSSKWVNALEGEPGKRIVGRSLRLLCHRRARFRWLALYGIDRATPAERQQFLTHVERAMTRL